MKKVLIFVLTVSIILGTVSAAYAITGTSIDTSKETAVKGYTDIKTTNWAYEAVNAMSEKGILKGYADGTFKPNNTITYGEFIKMALVGAINEDVGNSSTGNWALSYYNKALELKYFGATDIKEDQLKTIITRSDMALIISGILGDIKIADYDKLEQSVSDVDSKTKNDYDIIKSYATGILTGYSDGTFKPEGTLTRAEAVTVIYRLVDESKRVLPTTKADAATNTEQTVTIGYATSDETWERTEVTAKIGDYGIAKFEITDLGYVAMYSTIQYDKIVLLIDNKIISGFCNANGTSYWVVDGYYVYFAEPEKDGINVKGKIPSIIATDDNKVIKFSDITL